MKKKRITILGATGSVGRNVLDIVRHHPDRFEVVGLSTRRNASLFGEQCAEHPDAFIAVTNEEASARLIAERPELDSRSTGTGGAALTALIDRSEPDLVVNCVVGFVGLEPTLHAVGRGISVAIANKEAVVTGGELLRRASRKSGASLIPIDSEHVAISQCLSGARLDDVRAVYITASGGALRNRPVSELPDVTPGDVLAHPTWDMGDKITVDSATMMNKGLEVIEAHWLLDLPLEKISVVLHPQSVVHSLVEFCDNSILAQMGTPDMRLPILYALTFPERMATDVARSDVASFPALTFEEVDRERYPCFELAMDAARAGGDRPTVLNSANEVAVGAFLANSLGFTRIYDVIHDALASVPQQGVGSFEDIVETDRRTRAYIKETFAI